MSKPPDPWWARSFLGAPLGLWAIVGVVAFLFSACDVDTCAIGFYTDC